MAKTKAKTSNASKEAKKLVKKVGDGTLHLAFLVDESGSMHGKEEAVVSGYNEFVEAFQNGDNADVRTWLGMFDESAGDPRVRIKHKGVKIAKAEKLTAADYSPRGMTPLNDAIIDTITAMDGAVGKDGRAFVVILTDGFENASEHSAEDVAKVIKKREKDGWAFLYLGANQNAQAVAAKIGLKPQHALNFNATPAGVTATAARGTSRAMSYATLDSADYAVAATADSARTGGWVEEDDEEDS